MKVQQVAVPELGEGTLAVVAEALVPMLWWPRVPVLRTLHRELTALERFVLETGLSLGAVTAPEFAEITSLPGEVLPGLAADLVAAGVLQAGGSGYAVVPEVARQAVDSRLLARQAYSTAGFVLLPRHGDLLGVPADGGWLAALERHRPQPVTSAPVPRTLWEATRDRFLAERLQSGGVVGADPDLLAVVVDPQDPALVPSTRQHGVGVCPAYRCRAQVHARSSGTPAVHAVFHGEPAGAGRGGEVEVEADLSGAEGLVREWMALTEALTDPDLAHAAWEQITPLVGGQPPLDVRRRGPSEWEFLVSSPTASVIAAYGQDLSQPVGLAIEGDAAIVHVKCWFRRSDQIGPVGAVGPTSQLAAVDETSRLGQVGQVGQTGEPREETRRLEKLPHSE